MSVFFCPQCKAEMEKGSFQGKRMKVQTLKCTKCKFTIMYRNMHDYESDGPEPDGSDILGDQV